MITRLDPSGAGTYSGFTASAGSAYQCIDDGASPNDADYVYAASNTSSTYQMSDLPVDAVDITDVTITARMQRDGGNYADGGFSWKSGGSTTGTLKTITGGSYSNLTDSKALNFNGSVPWTKATVDAMECGVYSLYSFPGENVYCSWLKADVTHNLETGGFVGLIYQFLGLATLPAMLWDYTGNLVTAMRHKYIINGEEAVRMYNELKYNKAMVMA